MRELIDAIKELLSALDEAYGPCDCVAGGMDPCFLCEAKERVEAALKEVE